MSENFLIEHKDIAEIGYYFLDKNQEKEYLESINNELVKRVDTEIRRRLSIHIQTELSNLNTDEIFEYARDVIPDINQVIKKIRSRLLEEIRESRRSLLIKGAECEDLYSLKT